MKRREREKKGMKRRGKGEKKDVEEKGIGRE